jgi:DNA-binding transcriptional MocR family regulator
LRGHPTSYDLWIELAEDKPANVVADRLRAEGILVSSSEIYKATMDVTSNGLRLAFGSVSNVQTLREALQKIREQIKAEIA